MRSAPISKLSRALSAELAQVRYSVEEIHVSSLLHEIDQYADLDGKAFASEFERIQAHMRSGTELRETTASGDVMAMLTISAIRRRRIERQPLLRKDQAASRPLERTAFVIRSLKHPDEIRSLRQVYGNAFKLISSYSPRADRVTQLATSIAESRGAFRAPERKTPQGDAITWVNSTAEPKLKQFLASHLLIEEVVNSILSSALARAGVKLTTASS